MLCDCVSQTQRAELWKNSGELVNSGIDNQPQMSPWQSFAKEGTWLPPHVRQQRNAYTSQGFMPAFKFQQNNSIDCPRDLATGYFGGPCGMSFLTTFPPFITNLTR